MSTKKCLQCGKEFDGDEDLCPECELVKTEEIKGTSEITKEEITTAEETMETAKAGSMVESNIIEDKKDETTVEVVESTVVENIEIPEEKTVVDTDVIEKPAKKGLNKVVVAVIAVIVAIALGFGIKMYMDDQAHKAYVKEYNEYLTWVQLAQSDMLTGAADAEGITNDIRTVWFNAIWETSDATTDKFTKVNGTFVSDFNVALDNYQADPETITKIVDIETNQALVEEEMENLKNVPEGLEDHYSKISDLYDIYVDFTSLALSPTGSLNSYREKVSSLDDEFMSLYNKMEKLDFNIIE